MPERADERRFPKPWLSGPAFDRDGRPPLSAGWAFAPGSTRTHYFREVRKTIPALSGGQRVRVYLALCGATAQPTRDVPMFGAGTFPPCSLCTRKRGSTPSARERLTFVEVAHG